MPPPPQFELTELWAIVLPVIVTFPRVSMPPPPPKATLLVMELLLILMAATEREKMPPPWALLPAKLREMVLPTTVTALKELIPPADTEPKPLARLSSIMQLLTVRTAPPRSCDRI